MVSLGKERRLSSHGESRADHNEGARPIGKAKQFTADAARCNSFATSRSQLLASCATF